MTDTHLYSLLVGNRRSTHRHQDDMSPEQSGSKDRNGNRSIRRESKVRFSLGLKYMQRINQLSLLPRCTKYRRPIHGIVFLLCSIMNMVKNRINQRFTNYTETRV